MARMLSCLRGFLLGLVVILGFSGAVVSTISGIFLYQLHEYAILTPSAVDGPPATLLGLGVLTCVLAWFIWKFDYSAKSQIISLATLVALIAAVEAGVGIWALIRHQEIYALPAKTLQKAVFALNDPKHEEVWHRMHVRMNCCGVNGANEDFKQERRAVPWSCCYEIDVDRKTCERGCHQPVIHRIQSILIYAFLLALGSFILKSCTVATAWCYAKAIAERIKKRRREIILASQASRTISSASQSDSVGERNMNMSPLVDKS